jgi:hypothetical protein
VKLDWDATWRNWMRRAADEHARKPRSRQQETDDLFEAAMARAAARKAEQAAAKADSAAPAVAPSDDAKRAAIEAAMARAAARRAEQAAKAATPPNSEPQ